MATKIEIPPNHEELSVPFYAALGRSLAFWQRVESSLFVVIHAILGCEHPLSSTVFFHIKSPDAKLQLADKLCRLHFSDKGILSEWKTLHGYAKDAVSTRNKIGHFEIQFIAVDAGVLKDGEPPFALTSHHLDVNQNKLMATTSDLEGSAEAYQNVSKAILQFVRDHFDMQALRTSNLPEDTLQYLEKLPSSRP